MYTSTNAFEAGSHEVIYEPKIKKTQHIYDTTSNRNSNRIFSAVTDMRKKQRRPDKFRLTNIHADNLKFSFYQLKPNQSSDVSHIIS